MANNITGYKILLWSENPDKLAKFYRDVLKLEQNLKLELEDDYGFSFLIGKHHSLWIGLHDKVQGKNPRYVFTFLDPEGNCLQCMNG